MIRPARISLILFFMLAISSAMAQDNYYVLVKVNAPSIDEDRAHFKAVLEGKPFQLSGVDASQITMTQPDIGVKLTEGMFLGKYVAVEGTASWYGDLTATAVDGENNTYFLNVRQYGLGVAFLGRYPVLKWLHVYGKAGGAYNRIESDLEQLVDGNRVAVLDVDEHSKRRNRNEAAPLFGLGVQADIARNMVLSLDFEQVEVDDVQITSTSLGWGFRW